MENTVTSQQIIQGGMGFNISNWFLARTVAKLGQRGTVSGVSLERVMSEILRRGDPGGHFRKALAHFPFSRFAEEVLDAFFAEDGKGKKGTPVWSVMPSRLLIATTVCANFACVWLAKENHDNPVSINYLEKIAMPHIYAITGAMLADVDYITMGAGIPLQIPEVINSLVEGRTASYRIPVVASPPTSHTVSFDPEAFFGEKLPELRRPGFYPIVASNLLASIFKKKLPEGSVQGFVVEEPTAGGHNAPPRKAILDEEGELLPIYGEKDVVNYAKIVELGLPFWIGGSYASPEKLKWAQSVGAQGIQAGTIFALCEQSGLRPDIRSKIRELGYKGTLNVRTDMRISPTGFPFKVAVLDGTISEESVYNDRKRVCDQGALVYLYKRPDGSIGYRCPSEPIKAFVRKGGDIKDTVGRGCVCNGLYAVAGLREKEAPVATLGDDVSFLSHLMDSELDSYDAKDAIAYLLGKSVESQS